MWLTGLNRCSDLLTADEILELDTRQALSVENQRELMKIAASV